MDLNLPMIAGATSTIMFGLSMLPMLRKTYQTKDLQSYSLGNILLTNAGNVLYSWYVFNLPPGPIWLLHAFYLVTMGFMLAWYLRYEWRPQLRYRRPALDHVFRQSMTARVRSLYRAPLGPLGPRPKDAADLIDGGRSALSSWPDRGNA